ncbi:MATE family efflux transporter [Chthonobacter albigriseus]|uniref:MATE family efflux transporter n=1 Tax=Chthonobacter albigriseus TaxID=1683161 RepID=UPI0015EF6DC4|nr:MATE family efflux transporter [Chthonobacter albigriseus]
MPASEAARPGEEPTGTLGWHLRRTIELAAPIILSRTGLVIMFTVDTIMAGRAGELSLGAFGLGVAPLLTAMMISLGALQATVVLAAHAMGRGEPRAIGAILRASFANALLLGLLAIPLSWGAGPFFLATGQSPEVAAVAARVAQVFALGLPGLLLFIAANLILEATDRARVGTLVMLGANLANLALDGILVLGWGGFNAHGDAVTVMATSTVVRWCTFAAAFGVIVHTAARDGDKHGILATPSTWIRSVLTLGGAEGREIRRMGLPMGLAQGVEAAAFSSLIFIAGLIGTSALAAHQTTMTAMSMVYMNAVGLAGAASIRVGNALGRGSPRDATRAGWTAFGLGGLLSGSCGVFLVLFPEVIARWVVDEPAAVAVATQTLRIGGFLTAFDSMMGVTLGSLRGMGDVWMSLWLQCGAFWFVAIPLAYVLAIEVGFGAPGLFYGIGAGIFTSLALLSLRFRVVSQRMEARMTRHAASP